MAPSVSMKRINPKLVVSVFVGICIVFGVMSSLFLVVESDAQRSALVEYEFTILLKSNGELLQSKSIRKFVEKISLYDSDYFLSIKSVLSDEKQVFGSIALSENGKCVNSRYFQYDLTYCRANPPPWKFILSVAILFVLTLAVAVTILNIIYGKIILSFKALFDVAKIPYVSDLSFSEAWETANTMGEKFCSYQNEIIEFEKDRAVAMVAEQVAHDIRSPLYALQIAGHKITENYAIKELIVGAADRIKNIADDLLKVKEGRKVFGFEAVPSKNKDEFMDDKITSTLIDQLIAEKKLLFPVEILFDTRNDNFLFSANRTEMARIFSNLLNNSIESFSGQKGMQIKIYVRLYSSKVAIIFSDTGKGIPHDVIAQLGRRGLSYEKEGGSGLGLHHAKTYLESIGGKMEITSQVNVGTMVTITLPTVKLNCSS